MIQVTGKLQHIAAKTLRDVRENTSRRSFSTHSKKVNNAFLIVFEQYEKAFEELAKV